VKARALMIMLALLLGLLAVTGCSTDNNERQRLVAQADLVNAGTPLLIAGNNTNGTAADPNDDFVPIEALNVVFSARPLNDTMDITEFGPYSTFNITHYDLTWIPGPNAPAALTNYNKSRSVFTLTVPVFNDVEASILVGELAMKSEAWFPGTAFTADLMVTFYGHESGSEHEVMLQAGTNVQFVEEVTE
jgi:hypothetical protein